MNRKFRKALKILALVALAALVAWIFPWRWLAVLAIAYIIFGVIDVRRNELGGEAPVLKRYFAGNGVLTWLLSPFNLLMDLLAKRTPKILKKTDLPEPWQREIDEVIGAAIRENDHIAERVQESLATSKRVMLNYKWYGRGIDDSVPEFAKDYKYIKTIGVSVFNKNTTTTFHFGPLRITYRVLYNLSPADRDDVFIEVGSTKHLWRDDPMFIFDDTLMHRSANQSDQARYCMFIDIMRPSALVGLNTVFLNIAGVVLKGVNRLFYKNWNFVN